MGNGFCILRTKRIKNINGAFNHNLRIEQKFSKHVDHSKTSQNEILLDKFGFGTTGQNFEARIDQFIEDQKIFLKKGTTVKCLEFMLTASPDFFKTAHPKQIEDWKKTQFEFLKKEFGSSLVSVVVHNDEKTPHLSAIILADRKKLHKYKNQKGEFFKEKHTISPGDYNPDFLRSLQDRYAEANQKFGLVRGLRNSKATHKELKEFYAEVAAATSADYDKTVRRDLTRLLKKNQNLLGYIKAEQVLDILTPYLAGVTKKIKYLKALINWETPKRVEELNKLYKQKEQIAEVRDDYFLGKKMYQEDQATIQSLQKELNRLKQAYEPEPSATIEKTASAKPWDLPKKPTPFDKLKKV